MFEEFLDIISAELIICGLKAVDKMNPVWLNYS
jgi:hypothetical protein